MPESKAPASVKRVIALANDVQGPCKVCHQVIGTSNLDEMVTHYLTMHGYILLHIGTETDQGDGHSKELWHRTVAFLGY